MNDWAKYLVPPRRQRSLRFRLVRAVLGVFLAAATGVIFWAYFIFDSRQNIPLEMFVPDPTGQHTYEADAVFVGLEEATGELCGDAIPCNEAFQGERATLLRFDSKHDALVYTNNQEGDARQSNWIVIHFTDPTVTNRERWVAEGLVDSTWCSD